MKICFVASSGGHLEQILMLRPLMDKYDSFLVTEKTTYTIGLNNTKRYLLNQVNRREMMFPLIMLINFLKSLRIFLREKPDIVITTGVLSVIPMCFFAKVFRKELIYIESFAKVTSPTITGKLMYKYADRFYVQWPQMKEIFPRAIYLGGIY